MNYIILFCFFLIIIVSHKHEYKMCYYQSDLDECQSNDLNNCHEMATCTNTEGSFECNCNAGWEGSGVQCIDVDECDSGDAECHANADCTNTDGGYTCDCQDGYIGDGMTCSGKCY